VLETFSNSEGGGESCGYIGDGPAKIHVVLVKSHLCDGRTWFRDEIYFVAIETTEHAVIILNRSQPVSDG
jgi:hypothetical protein